jgi:hypothetical protein
MLKMTLILDVVQRAYIIRVSESSIIKKLTDYYIMEQRTTVPIFVKIKMF